MSYITTPYKVRAQLHNSALPAANSNLITDITASATYTAADQGVYTLRIYFTCSVAGNLILKRTRSAVTNSEVLAAVAINQMVLLDNIPVDQGETINLQYSVTTGTINKLMVIEKA